MIQPPETILVETHRVSCDGASAIRGGPGYRPAALGHPRIWLTITDREVTCPYCSITYVLAEGAGEDHGH